MRTLPLTQALQLSLAAAALVMGLPAGKCVLAQNNYGSYYQQQFKQSGGQLGSQSVDRYMYDKYFYHKPAVSPYMSLDRPDPMVGTNYQTFVRPEMQRREATQRAQSAYIDYRKREGRVGETRFPGATYGQAGTAIMKPIPQRQSTPSAYYNHWYGGWAK